LTRDARVSGRSQKIQKRQSTLSPPDTIFLPSIRLPRLKLRHAHLLSSSPFNQRPQPLLFPRPDRPHRIIPSQMQRRRRSRATAAHHQNRPQQLLILLSSQPEPADRAANGGSRPACHIEDDDDATDIYHVLGPVVTMVVVGLVDHLCHECCCCCISSISSNRFSSLPITDDEKQKEGKLAFFSTQKNRGGGSRACSTYFHVKN
jgi:hypothetical protein